ncbi:MAG: lytic transglycosylase domain-containing protein [Myxococcales bacterium]|nr:lytic transglycosylase domain-containing protein [Myxococcales bacterium]MCB9519995.1 lytic transglycosylase domain-containing protein [Myxococcales bacterium]MCB9534354.1 lytic transglycosylase domain-containing protein [Myxococcales bacterium]
MRLAVALSLLVAALPLLPGAARADIYRYVAEDGTVTFTTEQRRGEQPTAIYGEPERPGSSRATPSDRPNPNPTRDASAFDPIIARAAATYSLPFEFIKAVIRVESAFDPHAVSHAGAQGLMQLMPSTATSLNCDDPFDPEQNIMAGTLYLRILTNRYNGDINLVLAAYNAGTGTVAQYDGIPYEATRRYIERVYQYYEEYRAESAP